VLPFPYVNVGDIMKSVICGAGHTFPEGTSDITTFLISDIENSWVQVI